MRTDSLELLSQGASLLGVTLSEKQKQQFNGFVELLIKWNQVFNLTAITDEREIVSRHLLDSLSIFRFITSGNHLDIGCGAGFPSIPLAIVLPDSNFFCLDANGKKIRFVKQVIASLRLDNCQARQERVEAHPNGTSYQTIMCRAFASLADIVKLTDHLLQPETLLLAMKGQILSANHPKHSKSELNELPDHVKLVAVENLTVPGLVAERHLVILRRRILGGEDAGNHQSERWSR